MSDDQLQAAPDEQAIQTDPEIEKLKAQNQTLSQSVQKLEAKRTEALDETKKLKRIRKLLEAAGIDYEDEDAETLMAEKLLNIPSATAAELEEPEAPAESKADPIREAELTRLRRTVQKLEKDAAAAEKAKDEAIAKNREDRIERVVVEALAKAGAANPSHAYRLMLGDQRYRVDLSDDGTTVLGGPDYDPKPLSEVVAAFRDDDAFSYMFAGSGMAGSGMGSRANGNATGAPAGNNPFRTDSLNVTQAATLYQSNPIKAKQLMAEARSVGKLDPKFAALK